MYWSVMDSDFIFIFFTHTESCTPPDDFTGRCDSILGSAATITEAPLPFTYFDPDGKDNTVVTFSLSSVTPSSGISLFDINSQTGTIRVVNNLDVDEDKIFSYNLTVRIADQNNFATEFITRVDIADVNDNAPIPEYPVYNGSLHENSDISSVISGLNIVFTDPDSGVNGQWTYTLVPAVNFTLNSSASPVVYSNRKFDFETDEIQYHIEIRATDLGNPPRVGSATIVIDILDENDNRPVITETAIPTPVFIEQGQPIQVTSIGISDVDSSIFPMQYAIVTIVDKIDPEERLSYTGTPSSNLQVIINTSGDIIVVYGEGTIDQYATFLSTVTYQNLAEEMSSPEQGRKISFGVSDLPFSLPNFGAGSGDLLLPSDLDVFFTYYDPANVSFVNASILLQSVNDQPQVDCPIEGFVTFPSITEDIPDSSNTGVTIGNSSIVGIIADNDNAGNIGIAVIGTSGNGRWQYTLFGFPFVNFTSLSLTSATLLGSTTKVRFIPNLDALGSASIRFRAWDRSDGNPEGSTGIDTTEALTNSSSAFSIATCEAALEVTPVNDAPSLDLDMGGPNSPNFTTSYTENQTPTRIYVADPMNVEIVDSDNKYLQSLTVKISKVDGSCDLPDYPYGLSKDYLNPANLSILGIEETSSTEGDACWTYIYTGNQTIGNWEWFIGMLRLSINNSEPSDHTRRLEYIINDGALSSTPVYSFVTVNLVSDNCPKLALSVSSPLNYQEHGPSITIDSHLNITDDDYKAEITRVTVQIIVPSGPLNCSSCVLNVSTTSGSITSDFNDNILTIEGKSSPEQYQEILRTLTFHDTDSEPSFSSMITLHFDVQDETNSACPTAGDVTIVLQAVNDFAPSIRLNGASVNFTTSFTEGDTNGAVLVGNVQIDDEDTVDSVLYNITIELLNGFVPAEDELRVVSIITPATLIESSQSRVVIQGSLQNIITALNSVRYFDTNTINPSTHVRLISFHIIDGDYLSEAAFTYLTVVPVNDAPLIDLSPSNPLSVDNNVLFDVGGSDVAIAPEGTVADPDNANLVGMDVVLQEIDSEGNQTSPRSDIFHESLVFTNVIGITGSYDQSTGRISFSGTATLVSYQQLLRSIKYRNSNGSPSLNTRRITVTINDGSLSASAIAVVIIGNIPMAPVVDLNGARSGQDNAVSFTTKEDSPVDLAPQAFITDPDNDNICSAYITYTGPGATCTASALSLTSSFGDLGITMSIIANGFSYSVATSFPQCRETVVFNSLLRGMTFAASDDAPAGTCIVTVTVTDFRSSVSIPATVTISVNVGNEPPFIDLDLGRVGRHFTFEYIQGVDSVKHIVSIYNASLAMNLTSLAPVGEAPGEAAIGDDLGALIITNLSNAGYRLTDEDSPELEYISVKFLYESVADLIHDAIRFPCIPINESVVVDPIGCRKIHETVIYSDLKCDPNLFDACNIPNLCENLTVTITCGSKEYKFSYTSYGTVDRYAALLGNLGYEYIRNESVFTRIERTLNVTASDGSAVSPGALSIVSVVRKDDTPVIDVTKPAFTMHEDDRPGRDLIYYTVPVNNPDGTRAEKGSYILRIIDGDDVSGIFTMDTSGNFKLIGSLDYETTTSYDVIISAQFESNDPRVSSTATIVIQVLDVNDNRPQVQASYTAYIYENLVDQFVIQVNATDADEGSNAIIIYSPLLGIGAEKFSVNRSTGVVKTAEALNASDIDYYLIVLIIHDMGDIELYTHTVINIYVLPTPPDRIVFDAANSISAITIPENTDVEYFIGTVVAYEVGTMDSSNIRYRNVSVIPVEPSLIRVDSYTGDVYLVSTLDAERESEYVVTIEAYSIRTGIVVMSSTWNITITVEDIDEFAPQFFPIPDTISVFENTPIGTIVYTLRAYDNDTSEHIFVFELVNGGSHSDIPFDVLSDGFIIVTQQLDFETRTSYTFNVEVRDNSSLSNLNSVTTVNISIININDNAPYFTGTPYITDVRETAPDDYVVLTLTVADPDGSDLGSDISFQILENDIPFCIDGYNITVCNSSQLTSYETEGLVFYLTVSVIESLSGNILTNETSVTINVILINEYPPVFPPSDVGVTSTLLEQDGNCSTIDSSAAEIGDLIHKFNAADNQDGGLSGVVTYTLADSDGGPFSLNTTTGRLEVDGCVDADIKNAYTVTINATDGADIDGTVFTVSQFIDINIADGNDNPPYIIGPFYFVVRENETVGQQNFGKVYATDSDVESYNRIIEFSRVNAGGDGNQCPGPINIRSTGELYFCSPIDFDTTNLRVFMVALRAENPDGYDVHFTPKTLPVFFEVTVTLVDNNEFRPNIIGHSFEFEVNENKPNSTSIGTIPATDSDAADGGGGMIRYFLLSSQSDQTDRSCTSDIPFYAVNNGSVYTCAELDYEYKTSYFFYVRVCDMGNVIMCTITDENVTVNVIDRNDNPTIFPSDIINITIAENNTAGPFITLIWTDADSYDNSNVTLQLLTSGTPFGLSGNELVVTNPSAIDYEQGPRTYALTILAINPPKDPTDLTQETSIMIFIHILDINDVTPVISQPTQFTISENDTAGILVGTVNATDIEDGENGRLTYFSSSSDVSSCCCTGTNAFILDENNGEITTCYQLDYEERSSYGFIVSVCDNGSPQLCTERTFQVYITDINDNPPVFDSGTINLEIYENSIAGVNLYTIVTTDRDSVPNSDVTYTFVNTSSPFAVLNNNEIQYTGASPLDYESNQKMFMLHLRAINSPSDVNDVTQIVDIVVTITIIDRNDNPPVYPTRYDTPTIAEHETKDSLVYLLNTVDADSANNSDVYYQIISDNTPFAVKGNMLVVNDQIALDREVLSNHYSLVVEAVNEPGRSDDVTQTANITLNVTIQDINDNSPIFIGHLNFMVQENFNVGYMFTERVVASDADEGMNGVVVFTVESSTACRCSSGSSCVSVGYTGLDSSSGSGDFGDIICSSEFPFEIDHDSGRLSICHRLDFEEYCEFTLIVQACDLGSPQLCNTANVTVNIVDVNDNPPTINGPFSFSVNETVSSGYQVGCVNATDLDTGMGGTIRFYSDNVVECSSNFPFEVNAESGCINVCNSLNFEHTTSYSFTLNVTDLGDPMFDSTATISILVININDHGPVFTSPSTAHVSENIANALVAMVTAMDIDIAPHNSLTFSLLSNAGGKFNITSDGKIYTAVELDREEESYHIIRVKVDDGIFSNNQSINVTVTDVNDNRPFYDGMTSFTVQENSNFTIPLDFKDIDSGINAEVVIFMTSSGFTSEPNSLILKNVETLDRDPETGGSPSVVVEVVAIDKGTEPLSSNVTYLTLVVTDVNDNAPIPLAPFSANVKDDTKRDVYIATLNATDFDDGLNAELQFTLLSHHNMFYVNSTTGDLYTNTVIQLIGNTAQFVNVSVLVSDLGQPSLNATYNFVVVIVDNLPTFTPNEYTFYVEENTFNEPIGQVYAIDRDLNVSDVDFVYSIISSYPYGGFRIINSTIYSPANYLDYEDNSVFELILGVGNGEMIFDTANVTIIVNDTNDNPPILSPVNVTADLPENSPVGYVVTTLIGIDFDSGPAGTLTFTLLTGQGKNLFVIDSEGRLKTNNLNASDHELNTNYVFTYRACDNGNPIICSDPGYITITVVGADDVPPEFSSDVYSKVISENYGTDRSILTVNVSDVDTPIDSLTFRLEPPQFLFAIEQVTGIIRTTNVPLDYETTMTHVFKVRVTDTGGNTDTATITIYVLDVDDNLPRIVSPNDTFTFNEGQQSSIYFNTFSISEPDSVSQNTMDKVVLSLGPSPDSSQSYPYDGGFCDHANYSVIDNSSFGLCNIDSCTDLYDSLVPVNNALKSGGILAVDYTAFSLGRTDELLASDVHVEGHFTVSFWVKIVDINTDPLTGGQGLAILFSMESSQAVILRIVSDTSGNIKVASGANQDVISTTGVSIYDGKYHHVAVIRSGANMRIYVDGIIRAQNSNAGTITTGGTDTRTIFVGEKMTGYLAQINFCTNSSLSQQEMVCIVSCGEILSATSTNNVTASVDYVTRTVSLACNTPNSCTLSEMDEAVSGVSYSNSIDEPHPEPRGLYVTVKDAVGFGNQSVFSIKPILTNDKLPVLDLNGQSTSGVNYVLEYEELSPPVSIIGASAVLYDLDSGYWKFNRIVVELSNPLIGSEFLNISVADVPNGIEIIEDSSVDLGLIVRSITNQDLFPSVLLDGLRAIKYSNNQKDPTNILRVISLTVYDFQAVHTNSPIANVTVEILLANDPPTISIDASGLQFMEQIRTLTLLQSATVSITDVDSTLMSEATIELQNTVNGNDEFLYLNTAVNGINSTYDFGTHILTINGLASKDIYVTLLKAVVYNNSNANPTNAVRQLSIRIVDDLGLSSSTAVVVPFGIVLFNDPPSMIFNSTGTNEYISTFLEDTDDCVPVLGNFTLTDPENKGFSNFIMYIINPTNTESLTTPFIPGLPVFSVSGTIYIFVTDNNVDFSLLSLIEYCNSAEEPIGGEKTIVIRITDNKGDTNSVKSSFAYSRITIINVNDLPELYVEAAQGVSYGGEPVPFVNPNNITLSDNDSSTFTEIIITITNPQDSALHEVIQTLGNIPGSGILEGPIVMPNGSFAFNISYKEPVSNITIINGIKELRYNNLAGFNITINPPRVVCIQVSDGTDYSSPGCITIHVELPNQFAPIFLNNSMAYEYNETPFPITVGQFIATDTDNDPIASRVFYSIESIISFNDNGDMSETKDIGIFSIDDDTGIFTIPNGLDAEQYVFHNISIRARDNGNPNRYDILYFTITVNDVNDNVPQFTGLPYTPIQANVREELVPIQVRNLYKLSATDADLSSSNREIRFNLVNTYYTTDTGEPIFHINSTTGVLYYDQRLDAEQESVFVFNVTATDNGSPPLTNYTIIEFTPLDVNDNPAEVDQLTPALFISGFNRQPTSIGPAIRVTDPDSSVVLSSVSIELTSPVVIDDYLTCMTNATRSCQNERVDLNSSIDLMSLATFTGAGVTDTTIGERECSAKRFVRLSDSSTNGYGRIPRSSLSSSFGSGNMSFSFVANVTNEGVIVAIPDNTNPNASPSNVNLAFAIWFRRTRMSLYYTHNSQIKIATLIVSNLFDPNTGTYTSRHYMVIVSGMNVDFYANCKLLGSVTLDGIPEIPLMTPDVFIGRTIPGSANGDAQGHRHFGGVLHGLYYYPYVLSVSQIARICECERLIIPKQYSHSLSVTYSSTRIQVTGGNSLPPTSVNEFLRGVSYTTVLSQNTTGNSRSLEFITTYPPLSQTKATYGSIEFVQNDTTIPTIDLNGNGADGINFATSFTEDEAAVSVTSNAVNITRDNLANVLPTIQNMTVVLTNPVDGVAEYISAQGTGAIPASVVGGTIIEITGPGLPSEFSQVLRSIKYTNIHQNPITSVIRNITFSVSDTKGRQNDPLAYAEITIISVNDPPQLSFSSTLGDTVNTVTFHEGGSEVYLAQNATIIDVDNAEFTSARVTIINNFVPNKDELRITTQVSGITSTYDSNSGVLTISGSASLTDYHTVLRSITFNTSDNPLLDDTNDIEDRLKRTVTIVVNDGLDNSNSISVEVEFMTVNDPTMLHINGSSVVTYTEGLQPVYLLPYAYITDNDNQYIKQLLVQFVNIGETGDVFSDDGASQDPLLSYEQRSVTDLIQILRNITYFNTETEPSLVNRTVAITVTDFADNTNSIEITVVVKDRNDNPPLFIGSPYSFSVEENAVVGTSIGTLRATDADSTPPIAIIFTLNTTLFNTVSADSTTSAFVINNKVFDYETDPHSMTFDAYASDGELVSTGQVTVVVVNVNEPPILSITGTSTAAEAKQSRPIIGPDSVTITDQDISDSIVSATLTLSNVPSGSSESLTLNETIPGYTFVNTPGSTVYRLTKTGSGIDLSKALEYIQYTAGDIEAPLIVRQVIIKVTDEGGLDSNNVIIEVTLADEPEFSAPFYSATLDEGTLHSNFLQIHATVANPNDIIEYFVESISNIEINASTGYLSLVQVLDYEMTTTFNFKVYATARIPLPRTAAVTVYITVRDVNDEDQSISGIANITVQIGTPKNVLDGITVIDPDTFPLIRSTFSVKGNPLTPHPFSGKLCVDETNIITKMVLICRISGHINLLLSINTGPGAELSIDEYDNSILTLSSSYAILTANLSSFQGQINYFMLAFWFKPEVGQSGYIVFFSNAEHTERYLTLHYNSEAMQFVVTLKQVGVSGLASQAIIIFQLSDSIEDGNYHFIMIHYSLRTITLSVDGVPVTSVAVIYANIIYQVFGKCYYH